MAEKKSSSFGARKVAAKSLSEAKREKGSDDAFGWGDVFDLAVGAGVGLTTMNPALGLAAYQGSKGVREGIEEGDAAKVVKGAGAAYGAGKEGMAAKKAAEGPDYAGIFEGKTDDEIDAMLELEEQNRLLKT